MKYEVYCDESHPDLLSSQKAQSKYMVIGSLWLNADDRAGFKDAIHCLRDRHRVGGEFKWQKLSPSRRCFYRELAEWFLSIESRLRFRCIAVDHQKVDLIHFHENDQELGFYKFYYQMIHHWILDFNEYAIFCDFKKNRRRDRLEILKRCLSYTNLTSRIATVQAVRSSESVLIQLADVLTGAVAAKLNNQLAPGSAKSDFVNTLEKGLSRPIGHTYKSEEKFNVFVIDLKGGW